MSKQEAIARRDAGEDVVGVSRAAKVFEEHYQLAAKHMSPEHAAASAHDAVQRHLASAAEPKSPAGGEAMS